VVGQVGDDDDVIRAERVIEGFEVTAETVGELLDRGSASRSTIFQEALEAVRCVRRLPQYFGMSASLFRRLPGPY
jgi:hypothetical protein